MFASLCVMTGAALSGRAPHRCGWVSFALARDAWPRCWCEASSDHKWPGIQWGECLYCTEKASGPGPEWSSKGGPMQMCLWTRWSDGHCSWFSLLQKAGQFYSCTSGWPDCSRSPGCLPSSCTSEWCFPLWKLACCSSDLSWSSQVQRCPIHRSGGGCAQKGVPFLSQRGPAFSCFPSESQFIRIHLKEYKQLCYCSLLLEMGSYGIEAPRITRITCRKRLSRSTSQGGWC